MSTPFYDPFSVWKSFYTELEPKVSQSMQKWLESEEYAAFSGQLLSFNLQLEQQILKSVETLLQRNNIPTTKDIARLGEMIVGVETKVDQIDERLIRLEQLAVSTADLREQMTLVATQLEAVGKTLQALETLADKSEPSSRQRRRTQKEAPQLELPDAE